MNINSVVSIPVSLACAARTGASPRETRIGRLRHTFSMLTKGVASLTPELMRGKESVDVYHVLVSS